MRLKEGLWEGDQSPSTGGGGWETKAEERRHRRGRETKRTVFCTGEKQWRDTEPALLRKNLSLLNTLLCSSSCCFTNSHHLGQFFELFIYNLKYYAMYLVYMVIFLLNVHNLTILG